MAKNLMARYLKTPSPNHPKTNYAKDYKNITTADIGYGIPILCDEIMANSNVSLDLRCAMFTNPTVAPLYSRFKMQVTAWWAPISCYVPSMRDSVRTDATTDYSFPVINFDYNLYKQRYDRSKTYFPTSGVPIPDLTERLYDFASLVYGEGFPYIPTSSVFSYLRMWPSNFSPLQFLGGNSFPQPLNAVPLLMYYDIFRNYIINNQEEGSYLRLGAYHPIPDGFHHVDASTAGLSPRPPIDHFVTREMLDDFFADVRRQGMNYPTDVPYNITDTFSNLFNGYLFPVKRIYTNKNDINGLVNNHVFFTDYHYGLWRDTYMNDPYVAFISDENVNYEKNVAKVIVDSEETSTGTELSFTMEQIRMSSMIQNFVRSHIFRNNAFDEYTDVEYGCKPQRNLDKPLFLGSISSNMMFNDVMASAQTGESMDVMDKQQLGSRAAVGEGHMFTGKYRGKDKNGHYDRPFIKFHAPEPGYLMLILTIKPEVSYFEGYDPMYDKHSIFDLYRPSLKNVGYQDKCYRHINTIPSLAVDSTGTQIIPFNRYTPGVSLAPNPSDVSVGDSRDYSAFDVAYAHEPYGFEYMSKPNIITGQMTELGTYLHWTNARSLNNVFNSPIDKPNNTFVDSSGVDLLNTTILPEMYHYIFANTQNLDNFQFFYDFDYNVYQVVPRTILSFK